MKMNRIQLKYWVLIIFFSQLLMGCGGGGSGSDAATNEPSLSIEYTDVNGEPKAIPVEKVSDKEYIADISSMTKDDIEDNQLIVILDGNTANTNETINTVQNITNQNITEEQILSVTYIGENKEFYEFRVISPNNRFVIDISEPLERGTTELMLTVIDPTPAPTPA
ncbi:hypothetical protein MNBD_GAMMA03-291, partial [hydrothermal vent metagenome]